MLMKNAFTNKKAICFKPFTFSECVLHFLCLLYSFKNYTVHPTQNKTIKLLLYTLLLGINEFNKRGLKWFLNKIYTPEKDEFLNKYPPPPVLRLFLINELLRLISSWKSDLATSLAALELLRGLARINIPEQGLISFE